MDRDQLSAVRERCLYLDVAQQQRHVQQHLGSCQHVPAGLHQFPQTKTIPSLLDHPATQHRDSLRVIEPHPALKPSRATIPTTASSRFSVSSGVKCMTRP
ncbi:hypothetical protein FHU40_003243 [Nocardioides soli]|uniref:Uncharacterized protein n=1 Tax=Nocardioides soli TaxID=1036020 RepID=A0A7W4VXC8_9ACTN|nr:hypothetical protein [Nocardioides soli]